MDDSPADSTPFLQSPIDEGYYLHLSDHHVPSGIVKRATQTLMRPSKLSKAFASHEPINETKQWDYPNWGSIHKQLEISSTEDEKKPVLLDAFRATSIAGNDILASTLYTTGLTTRVAGPLAPFSLLLVCVVLWPFRTIYSEVGSALPLNGGSYNCLLNATSKSTAAIAAALSLISYTATAVVSASSATEYASGELGKFDVFWVTIAVLAAFALLTLAGVRDSANVALVIFAFHVVTLCTLIGACLIFIIREDGATLTANFSADFIDHPMKMLYYGFSTGLLGITGFETSANYIEEQAPGVFPKTMNAMWWLVTIFNPAIGLMSMGCLDIHTIQDNSKNVLSLVGGAAGGSWLRTLIAVDASVVLCGSVLTAYVGVGGLVTRLSMDRCLPRLFLRTNRWTKSHHWTILGFFLLTSSLYGVVSGDVTTLSGVYAVAFLSVMVMFAIGNMFLKYKRPRLPRTVKAYWSTVIFGMLGMAAGLVGNIIVDPSIVGYFLIYFVIAMLLILMTFGRIRMTKIILHFVDKYEAISRRMRPQLLLKMKKMKQHTVFFFTKTDAISVLNKAIIYAHDNELCDRVVFVHAYDKEENIPKYLEENHYILDHIYPRLKLDLLLINSKFTPDLVRALSKQYNLSPSFMFIQCPGENFPYHIGDFGGLRIIFQ
eukprot:GILK01004188.1.p1 GENE.GILK01004188.1~~GILK01004188.1.p1  ORF type:complete len:685 (+),score=76.45 GILK01004188.1:80-2056(+)